MIKIIVLCVGSTGRSKSKSSGVPRSRQSVVSSLPRTPKGEDVLFRPTTVEPDSSSDSEDYENYDLEQEYLLPSIGPPAILQYMKESQHPPMSNEEVEDRQELAKNEMLKKSMFSGPCMFCHEEILPFPTVDELERLTPDQVRNFSITDIHGYAHSALDFNYHMLMWSWVYSCLLWQCNFLCCL